MSAFVAPINPGAFRHRFMVRAKPGQQPTSYGYTDTPWSSAASRGMFWGAISALQGQEFEAAARRWAEARYQVLMHFACGNVIQRADRLYWGGRTLEILDSADPTGESRWWRLICSELVP